MTQFERDRLHRLTAPYGKYYRKGYEWWRLGERVWYVCKELISAALFMAIMAGMVIVSAMFH